VSGVINEQAPAVSQDAAHRRAVEVVQGQVRGFYKRRQKVKIYHGTTNSTRPLDFDPARVVDVSSLNRVLRVNAQEKYVVCEPNVPLDSLVDATLAVGLVPPMVAEFPGITVGGAIQGGSGESSSFKWGGFNATCLEYEIVLGNGTKVTASRQENAHLFWGMSCAYGSLGVITLVKIQLVPATKYVQLSYRRVASFDAAVATVKRQCKEPTVDFVDGILFSKTSGVIMTGRYVDDARLPKATFRKSTDEWFYLHAAAVTAKHDTYQEIIPLKDYIFRYDRGAFWTARYGFQKIPFNRFTRTLFAPLFTTRRLYKVLHGSGFSHEYLTQDICLPQDSTVPFLKYADKEHEIYPLWLCPLKPSTEDKLSPVTINTPLVINVGIWGDMKYSPLSFVERNRALETKVRELGGRKVLYAHSYYTEAEFWQIYDKQYYDGLRNKYDAVVTFPNLYDKITVTRKDYGRASKREGFKALVKSPFKLKKRSMS
jgi:FAD/FMN-containing dehydrogenase